MEYDWLKEIDYKEVFPVEYTELIEIAGIELFGEILDSFWKRRYIFRMSRYGGRRRFT